MMDTPMIEKRDLSNEVTQNDCQGSQSKSMKEVEKSYCEQRLFAVGITDEKNHLRGVTDA